MKEVGPHAAHMFQEGGAHDVKRVPEALRGQALDTDRANTNVNTNKQL